MRAGAFPGPPFRSLHRANRRPEQGDSEAWGQRQPARRRDGANGPHADALSEPAQPEPDGQQAVADEGVQVGGAARDERPADEGSALRLQIPQVRLPDTPLPAEDTKVGSRHGYSWLAGCLCARRRHPERRATAPTRPSSAPSPRTRSTCGCGAARRRRRRCAASPPATA